MGICTSIIRKSEQSLWSPGCVVRAVGEMEPIGVSKLSQEQIIYDRI